MLKPLCRSQQTVGILKRWGCQTAFPVSLETCMVVKKQQLEPDRKQWAGSKLGKEHIKAVHEPWTSRCSSWIKKRQRNQRSNCQHPLDHRKSKRVPEKHLLLFIDYAKAFDCVDHNKLWKILQEMGIPDHLTCLLRNLNASQEATVRTGHGTID